MEMKHTPGPWVVDPDSPTDISPADDLRLGIASISHADEAGGRWEFGEQSKANAKLIAAAPDLLAAAIKVLNGLNERIDSATENRTATPVFDGIADLHDAINKATA